MIAEIITLHQYNSLTLPLLDELAEFGIKFRYFHFVRVLILRAPSGYRCRFAHPLKRGNLNKMTFYFSQSI